MYIICIPDEKFLKMNHLPVIYQLTHPNILMTGKHQLS